MNKNTKRGIVVLSVLFVLFTVFTFVVPFEKNATLIAAYIFGVMAIAFQIYIFKLSFENADARSRFYGFPIAKLGVIYLSVQLIASIAEMGLGWVLPVWAAILINVFILGFAVIGCIAAETMRDEIKVQDNKLKANVSNMRELQSLANSLVGICDDEEAKKRMEKLAEKFRYSDPVSSEKTEEAENELKSSLSELQRVLIDKDYSNADVYISKIGFALDERNRICAVNK